MPGPLNKPVVYLASLLGAVALYRAQMTLPSEKFSNLMTWAIAQLVVDWHVATHALTCCCCVVLVASLETVERVR